VTLACLELGHTNCLPKERIAPAIPASPPVTIAGSDSSDGPGFAADPLPSSSGFAPPGSAPLLVGSGLDPSFSLSSQAPAAPVEKKKSAQTPVVLVEEKKFFEGLEAPSRVPESGVAPPLSAGTTVLGKKISSAEKLTPERELPLKKVLEPPEVKDPPFVCDQNWEKEAWKKEAELWGRISEMYPGVTEEQRQRLIEIWGKMIERKKHESKRELRNLQSSVNYGDIKASSRCRKDKAIRS
jgi:hypothetical protein